MTDHRPTDERVADSITPYVSAPQPGGTIGLPGFLDETGRPLSFDDDWLSGRHVAAVLVAGLDSPEAAAELAEWAAREAEIEALGGALVFLTAASDAGANRALKAQLGLRAPVCADPSSAAFAVLGLNKTRDLPAPVAARTVLFTSLRQTRAVWDAPEADGHAARMIERLRAARAAEEARWAAPHAPVLIVPEVFNAEECRMLIERAEAKTDLRIKKRQTDRGTVDYKIPVYEYGRQDRVDHIILDPAGVGFVEGRLGERVVPAVRKAFAFDVTRREDFHIACYAGPRSGVASGHRDNTTPSTAYRRFALSLNLNDDYEGGEVFFREYSNRGYRNPAGSALVFSSSLLHEVGETTKGVRYTLISHFFNDASVGR